MSITKAVKEKILGLFNQSSKDNEIRELKGEIAKVNAAKTDDGAKFRQKLEEAKKRRNLENRIRQLERDKIEAVEKEQNSIVNTIILPFMNDVWNTLDGISGEDTPPPIDILSFYSALSQRLKSTLDVTLPKNKKDARKEGLITYQNNTIWPWIKGLWKTVNE